MSDTNSVRILKVNNYITRSKWMLGAYAAYIVILGNDILKSNVLANRIVITGCVLGAAIISTAIVNFEQHLIQIRQSLYTKKKGSDPVTAVEKEYNCAHNCYDINLVWTPTVGLIMLWFLWFSNKPNAPNVVSEKSDSVMVKLNPETLHVVVKPDSIILKGDKCSCRSTVKCTDKCVMPKHK